MDISKIDKNFKIETNIGKDDVAFLNVKNDPFDLYGFCGGEEKRFQRLPDEIGKNVSDGVARLYLNTSGGRVRFCTDSSYVAIKAVIPSVCRFPHMPLSGTSGFDLYLEDPVIGSSIFVKSFIPPVNVQDSFEGVVNFDGRKMRWFTLNFPTYNSVSELYVGVQRDASVGHGRAYLDLDPVVYYGSSITQGGCSARPGNAYQAIVSRNLNLDFVNLGFSGCGKGEELIVDYMASMKMSAFVSDYDHNAPNAEHLLATHKRLYERVRAKHPNIPYIMLSKPDFGYHNPDTLKRRDIIWDTYRFARESGDTNVYFIDGESLFRGATHSLCTVDGCHPTDVGFSLMAEAVEHELRMAFADQYR